MNLLQVVKKAAMQDGKKPFLICGAQKRTYAGFYDRVLSVGAGLAKLGIKKGERVAIMLHNSIEFIEAYFGIISTGAAVVPLNVFLKAEEVTYILNDCRVKALFTSSDFKGPVSGIKPGSVPTLENIISVDGLEGVKHLKFESLITRDRIGEVKMSIEDMAVIIYTSGTTGKPKGAMLSHKNLVSNVENCRYPLGIRTDDVFLVFLPMFHSYSFTANVLLPLYMQCTLAVLKSVQPFTNVILSLIKYRVSVFISIPQIYTLLAEKKLPAWFFMLHNIKMAVSGGASLPVESLKKFSEKFRIPLLEGYGLSEASPICSFNHRDRTSKPGSIGQAIDNVEIMIADDNGKEVKRGESGELIVRGDNVMIGYYNNEEASREAIKDGWLYTGDIAKMDEEAFVFILDRKKDMIIVNGMNVYPREVEEVLFTHPSVLDAAVIGDKNVEHGEIPIAVVRLKENMKADEHELRKFCREHLANYKVPHRIEFWEDLPRNASGKVLKREIKRMLSEGKKI
jgi:long-chain acyl-CoA synthetase